MFENKFNVFNKSTPSPLQHDVQANQQPQPPAQRVPATATAASGSAPQVYQLPTRGRPKKVQSDADKDAKATKKPKKTKNTTPRERVRPNPIRRTNLNTSPMVSYRVPPNPLPPVRSPEEQFDEFADINPTIGDLPGYDSLSWVQFYNTERPMVSNRVSPNPLPPVRSPEEQFGEYADINPTIGNLPGYDCLSWEQFYNTERPMVSNRVRPNPLPPVRSVRPKVRSPEEQFDEFADINPTTGTLPGYDSLPWEQYYNDLF